LVPDFAIELPTALLCSVANAVTAPNLTRREQQVAVLVAQGLTNRQIAAQLYISERTAESHVEQIRAKLGIHSRGQVATWVAAQGMNGEGGPASSTPHAARAKPSSPAPPWRRLPHRRSAAIGVVLVASAALLAGLWLAHYRGPAVTSTRSDIVTLAGTGMRAFSEDGRQASASPLVRPVAVAIAPGGELYIAEGNRVRKVRLDGRITTLAGAGYPGGAGDGGPAAQAQLNSPQGLAIDSAGNVYIADTIGQRVRRVSVDGTITTVAGTGEPGYDGDGKPGRDAKLNLPTGLAIGFDDALFIADTGNNVIRQLGSNGVISTVAGTGEGGYRGDGGPAQYAVLHAPGGLAFDDEGNLYIADSLNERVRRIDVNGQIATVVGTGVAGYGGDGGPAIFAQLNLATNPLEGMGQGLAVGPRGEVVIADALNHRVRRLDLNGATITIAEMRTPLGVAVDPQGSVYVADADDNRVRRIG
jgi:DNA-binding CsgD family transcriptional regulator/sugar lactone lactonase YvrE